MVRAAGEKTDKSCRTAKFSRASLVPFTAQRFAPVCSVSITEQSEAEMAVFLHVPGKSASYSLGSECSCVGQMSRAGKMLNAHQGNSKRKMRITLKWVLLK